MISPGGAYRMGEAFRQMDEFAQIGNETSLENLMGFVDGIQENTARGILHTIREPLILWSLRDELTKKIKEQNVSGINLENYFGAYLNGYLWMAGPIRRLQDRFGSEPSKYSNAIDFFEIPRFKEEKYFRTKENIYNCLRERKLIVFDDENEN